MIWSEYWVVPTTFGWIGSDVSHALAALAAACGGVLLVLAVWQRWRGDARGTPDSRDVAMGIAPPPAPRPVEWRRAARALRALLDNPDDTEKAFEVFAFLDGASEERTFRRLLARSDGRRLATERPVLLAALSDRDALAALPAGSLGRAYLDYLERNGFEPDGLLALKQSLEARLRVGREDFPRLDAAREWYRDRTIVMHDLWHLLTGYGTDEMGEAALLAFTLGQVDGRANALLVFGIAARALTERKPAFVAYLYRAWRRGRRSGWLNAVAFEELLPLPLETARRRAGVEPPTVAHPRGILSGRFAPRTVPAQAAA